jgi:hypothetical protein
MATKKDFIEAPPLVPSNERMKKGLMRILMAIGNFFKAIGSGLRTAWTKMVMHDKATIIIMMFIAFTMFMTLIFQSRYYVNKYARPKTENFTQQEKLDRIKELSISWEAFKNMSPEEKLFRWIRMFKGWQYKLDGDPKYKQADCVGAVYTYFFSLGANLQPENVDWIMKRVENLNERGQCNFRTAINQVESGDLIILVISDSNKHVGMVIDTTPTGLVRYVDMNVGSMTYGHDWIKFGDGRIRHIADMSKPLWFGDFFKEF